jgi:hypothetical protein
MKTKTMMTKTTKAEDFTIYSLGICYASVCTSLTNREATRRLNSEQPVNSGWKVSKDKKFHSGQPNPCRCEDNPKTHRHILFSC